MTAQQTLPITCSDCRRHETQLRHLHDRIHDLEHELDRMTDILTWGNDWCSTCSDTVAAASSPGVGVESLETSGAGVLATPDPVGHQPDKTGDSHE